MVKGIINLTRNFLPKLSQCSKANIKSISEMPEMVLHKMRNAGDKSILYVDMNHCGAAIIKENGINTVFTDALNGCNSVGAKIKLNNGDSLFMLSHYVPTNVQGQIKALEKQLETYRPYFDSSQNPQIFFNIRGHEPYGKLEPVANPIIDGVKNLFAKFFNKPTEISVVPYKNQNRPAFFSSANIFQFNPKNLKELKITNVGEVEQFVK